MAQCVQAPEQAHVAEAALSLDQPPKHRCRFKKSSSTCLDAAEIRKNKRLLNVNLARSLIKSERPLGLDAVVIFGQEAAEVSDDSGVESVAEIERTHHMDEPCMTPWQATLPCRGGVH